MPLAVDFGLASETESIESFVDTNVAEYRFDNAKSFAVGRPSLETVELLFHALDDAVFSLFCDALLDV